MIDDGLSNQELGMGDAGGAGIVEEIESYTLHSLVGYRSDSLLTEGKLRLIRM